MANKQGDSIVPALRDGTVHLVDPTRFIRGDCDTDGQIEGQVTDAVFLLNYNFLDGPRPACLTACDADGDGRVEGQLTDAVFLLNYNFLDGPPPPAPFPECGAAELLEGDDRAGCRSSGCL